MISKTFLCLILALGVSIIGLRDETNAEVSENNLLQTESEDAFARAEASKTHRYIVKGEIRQLPKRQGAEIFIRHEPIPDYVDKNGKVVGMRAMTMPFWLADGVSIENFSVGDKVEFVMESEWQPKAKDTIVSIKPVL